MPQDDDALTTTADAAAERQSESDAMIEALQSQVSGLNSGIRVLAASLERAAKEQAAAIRESARMQVLTSEEQAHTQHVALRRRTWMMVICLLAVALAVAANLRSTHQIRDLQTNSAALQRNNAAILAAIHDCTDSSGACARRGQAGQASAVATIGDATLADALCALAYPDPRLYRQAKACVAALVAPPARPAPPRQHPPRSRVRPL